MVLVYYCNFEIEMEYMIIDFQKQDIKPCTNTNYVLASLHMQCLGTSTNRQTDRRTDRLKRKYSDHVYRYPLSFDCNLWRLNNVYHTASLLDVVVRCLGQSLPI